MDIVNTLKSGISAIRRAISTNVLPKSLEFALNNTQKYPFNAFSYSNPVIPNGYKCGTCGKSGCKLWREYQTFLDQQTLECCDCAGKGQDKDVSTIDADGRRESDICGRTDQIGWRIPAVPTEDGSTYWGYSSVPQAGVNWWRSLPTR